MSGTFTAFREDMLSALYQEQMHEGVDELISFRELAGDYGIEWREGWLIDLQKQLISEGFLLGPSNGSNDQMAIGKLIGPGLRYIEERHGDLEGVPTMIVRRRDEDNLVATDLVTGSPDFGTPTLTVNDEPVPSSAAIESEAWTGRRLSFVDTKVIARLRVTARELSELADRINFQSEEDARDIRGLARALVSLSEMAEPDVPLILKILAHPKFKIYGALFSAAAAVRGALGI